MLHLVITCLVIALIAALLGFGGIAGSFVGVAQILFASQAMFSRTKTTETLHLEWWAVGPWAGLSPKLRNS